jgi:ABC-type Mn2+/Zn2+ transport system permease subunit
MIIVPPAVARRLSSTLDRFLVLSSLTSVAATGVGFSIASVWHVALGPTIVAVASALFVASLMPGVKPTIR